ncbi:MAG: dynamin family protein [Kineosporiaceae bacterium]
MTTVVMAGDLAAAAPVRPVASSSPDAEAGLARALVTLAELAREGGQPHLADGLVAHRAALATATTTVAFVGEFGAGRSAVVNGLVGVPVCGVSATRATTVPTLLRWGPQPAAARCRDADGAPAREVVPLADVASASLEPAEAGTWLEAELPRGLLATGLRLLDLPGLGGGISAPQASTLLRGLESADAVVYVADSAAELTTPDLDLLAEISRTCPSLAVVLTRTDLHPHWRRIAEIDRRHLADAGVDAPVVAVSAPLRALALRTGDPALHAESGFGVLVDVVEGRLRARQRADLRRRAGAAAQDCLARLAEHLDGEHAGLAAAARLATPAQGLPVLEEDPEATLVLPGLREREQRARELLDNAARWRELLADRIGEVRRAVHADLVERRRRMRDEIVAELDEIDPAREWSQFSPWMTAFVTTELAAHRRGLLAARDQIAQAVAARLDLDGAAGPPPPATVSAVPAHRAVREDAGPPPTAESVPEPVDLPALTTKRLTRVDLTMNAVRGMTLGSSVGGIAMTLLPAAGITGLLTPVTWPLVAVVGATFAVRSVRGAREASVTSARMEARRVALGALEDAVTDAQTADEDALARTYEALRDHFGVIAQRAHLSAVASLDAAAEAMQVHGREAATRLVTVARQQELTRRWSSRFAAAMAELDPAGVAS